MRVVAIVNRRARRAGSRAVGDLERVLPGCVRFTESLEAARAVIRAEVARGVDVIALAGGDGTIVMGLALIDEACRGHRKPAPAVGVLRLGSGNALADALGASDDCAADLIHIARGEGQRIALPLVLALGVRAPFIGVGVDAQLLEDQAAVGRAVDRVPLARRLGGGARYALSVALRSLPRFAFGERAVATVVNRGAPAIELSRGGPTGRMFAAGETLWRGNCTLVAAATIRYFGFGLQMFPFAAARADRFQLRCGDAGLAEIALSTRAAFRGEYFSERVRDFHCDRIELQFDRDTAVEAGGELLAKVRSLDLALATPATMISWI